MISKKLLIIVLIFAMSIPIISYAINLPVENGQKLFLSSDKVEASKGEKITLSLNLDLIKYENFEFTLSSNTNLEAIDTEQENIETTTENNTFKIIANKAELNINQIDLYYKIPEDIEIGTKINLTGIVREYKNENTEKEEGDEQVEESVTEEVQSQEVTIIITVVEKREENEEQGNNQSNNQNNNQGDSKNQMMENNTKNEQTMSNEKSKMEQTTVNKTQTSQVQTQTISTSLSGAQETNTYKGESNNYLSSLEITNYNMNPEFAKTNATYFLEVESDVTAISISAEAEDDDATVNVYGNSDLEEGENKVLISVTAENGDVKMYRIYVTRK